MMIIRRRGSKMRMQRAVVMMRQMNKMAMMKKKAVES